MGNVPGPPRLTGSVGDDSKLTQDYLNELARIVAAGLPALATTFTISGSATTGSVSFATARDDTNYRVLVTARSSTGAPATNAFVVTGVARTAASFTVTVAAAPGGTASVTFDALVVPDPA